MLQGFKDFIARGNAVEMAVGIVIGAAFGNVVTVVVEKVIDPLIAGLFGQPNFDDVLAFPVGNAVVMPGAIITALIQFLLVAIAVYFFIVVPMNKLASLRAKEEEPSEEEIEANTQLLTEIRDLLARQ